MDHEAANVQALTRDGAASTDRKAHTVARLERLQLLLDQNRTAYYRAIDRGRGLSRRMYGWIDEYNDAKGSPVWVEYCKKHGLAQGHTALDTLA